MKSGLSGGAAANNINMIQMHYGRTMLRYTDRKVSGYAARALISRVTLNEFDAQDAWTVATS
jgi:hypothetical protein